MQIPTGIPDTRGYALYPTGNTRQKPDGNGTGMVLGDTRPDYPKLNTRLPEIYTRKLLSYIYIFS